MAYQRGFKFDQGSIGRNLAELDREMRGFIDLDADVHTTQGELAMKTRAPWKDRTGNARRGLWATNEKHADRIAIRMGHTMQYGVYLEESNQGKFQIIMPVLLETAKSFMRSLNNAFAQLESKTPVTPFISPGTGTRPGTSQGAKERTIGADSKPNVHRDEHGRFSDQGKGFSKAAKLAKAELKKHAEKLARRRAAYAVRKGTAKTKRTRRG